MMLQNDCLPTGKVLHLSHVSSNINMALEMWNSPEYFVTSNRIKQQKGGSWIYVLGWKTHGQIILLVAP